MPISVPGVAPLPPECFPAATITEEANTSSGLWGGIGIDQDQATDFFYQLHRIKITGSVTHRCGVVNRAYGGNYQQCAAPDYWYEGDPVPAYPSIYETYGSNPSGGGSSPGNPYPYSSLYLGNVISAETLTLGPYPLSAEVSTDYEPGPTRVHIPSSPWGKGLSCSNDNVAVNFTVCKRSGSIRNGYAWILNPSGTIWPSMNMTIQGPDVYRAVWQHTPMYFNITGWHKAIIGVFGPDYHKQFWMPIYTFHHLGETMTGSPFPSPTSINAWFSLAGTQNVHTDYHQTFSMPLQWHGKKPFTLSVPMQIYTGSEQWGGVFAAPFLSSFSLRMDMYPA